MKTSPTSQSLHNQSDADPAHASEHLKEKAGNASVHNQSDADPAHASEHLKEKAGNASVHNQSDVDPAHASEHLQDMDVNASGKNAGLPGCRNLRPGLVYVFLLALVFGLALANLATGSVSMSPWEIVQSLTGVGDSTNTSILIELRMPRLLSAMILGGALSVSGYLLQTYFNNPLAGPFVLGISSGAKLLVAIVMILMLEKGIWINSWGMIGAAFLGAMISMGFILLVSGISSSPTILIISGVLIGYFCNAVTELFITFARDTNIVNLHTWSQGSFSGITWQNVIVMSIVTAAALFFCAFLAKPMGAWQMGEAYALNLGVNVRALRFFMIFLSSLLSACVSAFAGPVAFVGIAVPHLMRSLQKTSRVPLLLPACFLGGSAFCLLADLIARNLFAPTELSISVVTSVLGAPVVIMIMLRRQGRRQS